MRRMPGFSKLLLLIESAAVVYTTVEGVALAQLAIEGGYGGSLSWLTAMVGAAWSAYGASAAFYYNKAKAENTAGGIVYEAARRGETTASRQDCE